MSVAGRLILSYQPLSAVRCAPTMRSQSALTETRSASINRCALIHGPVPKPQGRLSMCFLRLPFIASDQSIGGFPVPRPSTAAAQFTTTTIGRVEGNVASLSGAGRTTRCSGEWTPWPQLAGTILHWANSTRHNGTTSSLPCQYHQVRPSTTSLSPRPVSRQRAPLGR